MTKEELVLSISLVRRILYGEPISDEDKARIWARITAVENEIYRTKWGIK